MRDCDTDSFSSLRATKAREAEQAHMVIQKHTGSAGYEMAREMTAHDLLQDLEYRTNQRWLDLQALRRALPQELLSVGGF